MMAASRLLPRLALAGLMAAFVVTGVQGIDFGEHWDERSLADRVKWSIVNGGTLLPGSYDWPSVPYWLALASLAPDIRLPRPLNADQVSRLETHLVARLDTPEYRLRVRRTFLLTTSFVLLWAYLAASAWTGSPWCGVAAAGVVGGSWQFAYHARWPAPDGLVVQFVGLIVLGAVLTRTRPSSALGPTVGAVASGLAVGSKYTAWPFALTWLASDVAWRYWNGQSWVRPALRGAALGAGAFMLSTPGVVLQPLRFLMSLAYLERHYSHEATVLAPYVVGDGWPMLSASVKYLGAVLLSPWMPVAVMMFALAVAGMIYIGRRDATLTILLVGGPVLLVSAMSLQPVLIVRNLLPVIAVAPVAVAAALAEVSTRFPSRRRLVVASVVVVLSAHLVYLARAALTIGAPHLAVQTFQAEFSQNTCASAQVAASMASIASIVPGAAAAPVRVCSDKPQAVMPGEARGFPPPLVGRPRVLGPLDVDALYYPTWLASQHILIVP